VGASLRAGRLLPRRAEQPGGRGATRACPSVASREASPGMPGIAAPSSRRPGRATAATVTRPTSVELCGDPQLQDVVATERPEPGPPRALDGDVVRAQEDVVRQAVDHRRIEGEDA